MWELLEIALETQTKNKEEGAKLSSGSQCTPY